MKKTIKIKKGDVKMSVNFKIGVTERGDAGINLEWLNKISEMQGAVLITKNITDAFIASVMPFKDKIIIHATITGWGGSIVEPGVPYPEEQITHIRRLIAEGFPASHIVIRIDPIIPVKAGVSRAQNVINLVHRYLPELHRYRFSVLDMYPHVRQRFIKNNILMPYNGFNPPDHSFRAIERFIESQDMSDIFETCAEKNLSSPRIIHTGCISETDLKILNLDMPEIIRTKKQRPDCLCLPFKTEMLSSKHRCSHKCLYCYWYD